MKKSKFYQKTAAFLAALLMLSAFTACNQGGGGDTSSNGGKSNSNGGKKSGKTNSLDISFDHSYASEKLSVGEMRNINQMFPMGDNLLLSGFDDKGQTVMYLYNFKDDTSSPAELAYPSTLDDKTDYYVAASFTDAENNPVFIYHAYTWDDENEEDSFKELGFTMETYDQNLNLIDTKDLNNVFNPDEEYFQNITADKNGNYIAVVSSYTEEGQKVCIYDKDFNKTGEIEASFQYVEQMCVNPDGKVIIIYEDDNWDSQYGIINIENKSIDKFEIEGTPQWFNTCFVGKKDYDLYLCNSTGAYGVNLEKGICEEAINWVNSDFMGDFVNNVIQLDDGRFVLVNYDYTNSDTGSEVWILNERDPEELKNVKLISLATLYMSSDLGKAVNQFNRTNSEYRIGILDYEKYNTEDDYQAGLTQFENDMTSGLVADIISMNSLPYERYANKGLFLDLTDYVNELNSDEYFTNFFKSMSYGGKIQKLGFSFNIQTLEAKSEHVGTESGVSLERFMEILKNMPEGMEAFRDMSREVALSTLLAGNLNSFIDVSAGTCNFNTPTFVELLELCKAYPEDADASKENWTDEEWNKYWEEEGFQYINNKTLFRQAYLSNVKSELQERMTYFDKADVTLIGYPTLKEDSNGGRFNPDFTLAISANSENKDQAWSFFKSMLEEDFQESLSWSCPVRKEAFDKMAAKALEPDTYTDQDGTEVVVPFTVYRGMEEVEMPLPTQEDIDKIKSYIEGVTETNYYDEQIYNIIDEEAQKFFAGDQTAQAAADMIQSRASLYLSEQN